jgi:hypothetical protein
LGEACLVKRKKKGKYFQILSNFYSPIDAQMPYLKNNIKIDIKTAPTCFGAVTPSSGHALIRGY